MFKNNVGSIVVPLSRVTTAPEEVSAVFSLISFVPIRAEALVHRGVISYIGLSPEFEELKPGSAAPSYMLTVLPDEDGKPLSVQVQREDDGEDDPGRQGEAGYKSPAKH